MTAIRIALSAHLARHSVKLVHVWRTGDRWNAMAEWPYDPTRKKPLVTERHATGVGDSAETATIAALDHLGLGYDMMTRLWVIGYLLGRMA